MPKNHNALIRYMTLDRLLASPYGHTRDELIAAVEAVLAEHGKSYGDSTFRKDVAHLRDAPFFADIVCEPPSYRYRYADSSASLFGVLREQEVKLLEELSYLVQQWQGNSRHEILNRLYLKLSELLHIKDDSPKGKVDWELNIHFESGKQLGDVFEHLLSGFDLLVRYESFLNEQLEEIVKPQMLKEYNKRWYLVANRLDDFSVRVYALDRIQDLHRLESKTDYFFDTKNYFSDCIGLTRLDVEVEEVRLRFTENRLPYVQTKPLHDSQKNLQAQEDKANILIEVKPNPELTQTLLSFGSDVEVLSPLHLRDKMKAEVMATLAAYHQ